MSRILMALLLTTMLISTFRGEALAASSGELGITRVQTPSVERTWANISLLYENQYHTPSMVQEEIDRFNQLVPDLVDVQVIGQSYQGRNISVLRITNELNEEQKPETLVVAQHHGREQITVETALRFALRLVNSYGLSDKLTQYVDEEEIYIIPSLNPDALERVVSLGDYWLRKNLRPFDNDGDGLYDEDPSDDANGDGFISSYDVYAKSGPGGPLTYLYSYFEGIDNDGDGRVNCDEIGLVDLNRNYDRYWGAPGSSSDPRSEVYHGAAPFSEPETQAFKQFALQHRFSMAYTLHSGTNATYFPTDSLGRYTEPSLYTSIFLDLESILPSGFHPAQQSSSLDARPRAQRPVIETGCGMWEDWMYSARGTEVPITFEIYHNASVDSDEALTTIIDNSTHYITEWHDIFGYFDPVADSIDSLWAEIVAAFDYLLGMTPRLDIVPTSRTGGVNQGDTVNVVFEVESLSPRLGSTDDIEILDMNGTTLGSLEKAMPQTSVFMEGAFQLPVDLSTLNYTVRVGNNYTGYTRYIFSSYVAPSDSSLLIVAGATVVAASSLSLGVVFARRHGRPAA